MSKQTRRDKIRARMAATGESYTTAKRALENTVRIDPSRDFTDAVQVLAEASGEPTQVVSLGVDGNGVLDTVDSALLRRNSSVPTSYVVGSPGGGKGGLIFPNAISALHTLLGANDTDAPFFRDRDTRAIAIAENVDALVGPFRGKCGPLAVLDYLRDFNLLHDAAHHRDETTGRGVLDGDPELLTAVDAITGSPDGEGRAAIQAMARRLSDTYPSFQGQIRATPQGRPELVFPTPGTPGWVAWYDQFRDGKMAIGAGRDGWVTLDFDHDPHWLFAGDAGTGKTALLRTLREAALAHPDRYEVHTIDPVGAGSLGGLFAGAPQTKEEAAAVLGEIVRDLGSPERAEALRAGRRVVVLVDAADVLLAADVQVLEQAASDIRSSLLTILQLGRSLGVHLVLATQNVSASIMGELLDHHFSARALLRPERTAAPQVLFADDLPADHAPLAQGWGWAWVAADGHGLRETLMYRFPA